MFVRRLSILICFIGTVLPASARSGQDLIGLYYDTGADTVCCEQCTSYPRIDTIYLVLSAPSAPSVSAWECQIDWDPTLVVSLQSLGSPGTNFSSFPCFHVVFSAPVMASESIVLASMTLVSLAAGNIYLRPAVNPSLPAMRPVYASGEDPEDLRALDYDYGSATRPVLSMGDSPCPSKNQETGFVETRYMSMGAVKALYSSVRGDGK